MCVSWSWNCAWCTVAHKRTRVSCKCMAGHREQQQQQQHIGDYKNRSVLSTERRQKPKDRHTHTHTQTKNIHILYVGNASTKKGTGFVDAVAGWLVVCVHVFVCMFCMPISPHTLFHPLILAFIHLLTHTHTGRTHMQDMHSAHIRKHANHTMPHNSEKTREREKKTRSECTESLCFKETLKLVCVLFYTFFSFNRVLFSIPFSSSGS